MGNAQSELTSEQPSHKHMHKHKRSNSSSSGSSNNTQPKHTNTNTHQTTIPLNDYDPNGAVIPDIPPMEVLRTALQIEKFERCLACVPLTIDPRSPRSQMMDSALAEAARQLTEEEGKRSGGSNKNMGDVVDVMSTIEEGDSESTSFQERQLHHQHHNVRQQHQQQQQQQHQQQLLRQQMYEEQRQQMYQERFQQEQEYHDHGDPWIPATFPKNDTIASQWLQHPHHQQHPQQHHPQQYQQQALVNKSTSTISGGEYSEFDPDKIIIIAQDSENQGSAEFTEFDPDAMIAEEEQLQQQEQLEQQQHQEFEMQQQRYEMQQPIDSDELDDVLMMRSDDGDALEERYQDTQMSQCNEDSHQAKQPSQQIIGLTEPMEVGHRTTQKTMNVEKNSGERYQFLDQDVVHGYLQQENATSQSHHDERAENIGSKKHHDMKNKSQPKTKHHNDWRDDHQLTIRTEVGDANKIANQHFDDIISDFEISSSPRLTPREKAYSNVRSWKTQRLQKQRRNNRRKNDIISTENSKTPKQMYSPQTSNAASFVARTTVGRKLNGISPKTMRALPDDYYDTPPSDDEDAIPEYVSQSVWKDSTTVSEKQPSEDYSSYLYEGSDPATSSAIVDSYSSAVMTESDIGEVVESYSSNQGNVPSVEENNRIDSTMNTSYSAEKTLSKSTEEDQNIIVNDSSAESTVSSRTFEETHAKLKGLLRKNSYESESISDSINWDNLAYSISDGTPTNSKAGDESFDEVLAARGESSLEEEASDQSNEQLLLRKDDTSSENDDKAITGEGIKDKIKQMKKQHEDDMKSYMDESHNTPSLKKYTAVQKRIDAMRDQHKANIDNMRAALKETDDDRNPPESSRTESSEPVLPSTSSNRFNFDDTSSSKTETRTKAIRDLMAQNAKLEQEMKLIRSLSPRSPESFEKYSPKQYTSTSSETFSRHKYHSYMSSIESPKTPESTSSGTDEAREALSTMIFDINADDEQMNTRLNGMIADIKNFLQENDDLEERLSKDIMTYGV